MLHIILAEDHTIVRNGLKILLESDENITIVGEAANGQQVIDILEKNDPVDLVLSDVNMPEMDGIALTRAIKELGYTVKVVLLSMHDNENFVYEAFRAGADAYLLKTSSAKELTFALHHVFSGELYLCSTLIKSQIFMNMERNLVTRSPSTGDIELSPRELEVLDLLAKGMTNKEMSDKLFLSKRTVEGHRQSLIDKFAVRNTAELICLSMRTGLIS